MAHLFEKQCSQTLEKIDAAHAHASHNYTTTRITRYQQDCLAYFVKVEINRYLQAEQMSLLHHRPIFSSYQYPNLALQMIDHMVLRMVHH